MNRNVAMSETPMKKQAFLIGINQYQNLSELKYARQDAEAVAEALKENYGFSDDEIILLTDSRQGRFFPSIKSVIQWQLEDLIKQGNNYDLFIFGFWGHGLICNGQRYLCPQTVMDEEVSKSGFSFVELQKQLVKVKAKNTCIILDCCQTLNGRGVTETLTSTDKISMKSVVRDIIVSKNKLFPDGSFNAAILNSCSEGQVAYEWDERRHGIFTAFLLDAMNNQCDSVSSIVSYLGNKVKKTALEMGKVQTPFCIINNEGDIPLPVSLQDRSSSLPVKPQSASSVFGDVFISYKHDNIDLVEPVLKELEKRGISFFIDNDEEGILPGQNFAHQIPEAIKNCKALLLFWTEEVNQAPTQIEYEVNDALTFKKPIIPYKIGIFKTPDPNTFIHYLSGKSQYIVVHQTKKTIAELVNRIERFVSKTNLKPNVISTSKTFPKKGKLKRIGAILLVLFFVAVGITALFSLNGKRSDDVKSLLNAAKQGDIEAQYILGENCFKGERGENKNYVEAVKWYRKAAEQGHSQAQYKLGVCYESGYGGLENNIKEAINWWRKAADLGNPEAQLKLGYCYFNGVGVEQNFEEAAKWYRKAAERGNPIAQNSLGDCYKNGKGVPQDYAEAFLWYGIAAEHGNLDAHFKLGMCYAEGIGVEQNYDEAIKWYREAAYHGNAFAKKRLADCYRQAAGVERDNAELSERYFANADYNSKACLLNNNIVNNTELPDVEKAKFVEWYRKAAEQGNALAQNSLADCYENGIGVKRNFKEAMKWYRKAAEQGISEAQNSLADCYKNGKGVSQDYAEAVKWYSKAAQQDNANAQYNLGLCYSEGAGVEQNIAEAAKWFNKSAEQGNALAQNSLADCYKNGDGVPQDVAEAAKWYSKAAQQDIANAQYNLGLCYSEGAGVEQDIAEAAKWFHKSAEHGNVMAQNSLADCYRKGTGVEQDYAEAIKWYRKAADKGNALAQNSLADCYKNGEGVPKDLVAAVEWYLKAAEQGNDIAQYNLGTCYSEGRGVAGNAEEYVEWFRKSAEQGNALAQIRLGVCYANGEGVEQNFAEAVKWFRQAAEQENAVAQYNLGLCYSEGVGVEQDYAEAVKWHRKAAEQGNALAQCHLGDCYANGKGVARNREEAVKWYRESAEQGNALAQNRLEKYTRNDSDVDVEMADKIRDVKVTKKKIIADMDKIDDKKDKN